MSIENKMYTVLTAATALTALVGTAIYPDHMPQESNTPMVVYGRVSGLREYHLQGYATLENIRMRVDAYSTDLDGRRQVTDQIIAAMEGSLTYSAIAQMSPFDDFDDVTQMYRRTQDFSIWNKE